MRQFVLAVGAVAAGIGAALALGRYGKRRGRRLGEIDPYAATGEPEIDEADFEIAPGSYSDPDNPSRPRRDEPAWEGGCLNLGNKHFRYGDPYRVCLTANQERTLFKNKRTKLRKLGCGVFACAYQAPAPSRVVKLTRDAEDVAALLEAQKTGVVPKVWAVYKLAQGGRTIPERDPFTMRTEEARHVPVYALVVEKLRMIPSDERDIVDTELSDVTMALRDGKSPAKVCASLVDDDGNRGCSNIQLEVLAAFKRLQKIGITWYDMHAGNVGYDKRGKLKVLDLGVTGTQLKREPDVLEGIQRAARARLARKPLRLVP